MTVSLNALQEQDNATPLRTVIKLIACMRVLEVEKVRISQQCLTRDEKRKLKYDKSSLNVGCFLHWEAN